MKLIPNNVSKQNAKKVRGSDPQETNSGLGYHFEDQITQRVRIMN